MLTNYEIVDRLARDKTIEKMIGKITNNKKDDTLFDLSSDTFISLLTNPKVPEMYERGELNYFIARMLMNNICSKTSPYYRTYIKPNLRCEEITSKIEEEYADD